jgi:hypothetical protein
MQGGASFDLLRLLGVAAAKKASPKPKTEEFCGIVTIGERAFNFARSQSRDTRS